MSMAAEHMDLVLSGCRRCHRHHIVRLPDGTPVDSTPIPVESPCPRDEGRRVWVSLGATGNLLAMNTRNMREFLRRLEHEKRRHLRRAIRADLKAARKRAEIEAEGDEFRWVG